MGPERDSHREVQGDRGVSTCDAVLQERSRGPVRPSPSRLRRGRATSARLRQPCSGSPACCMWRSPDHSECQLSFWGKCIGQPVRHEHQTFIPLWPWGLDVRGQGAGGWASLGLALWTRRSPSPVSSCGEGSFSGAFGTDTVWSVAGGSGGQAAMGTQPGGIL